MCNFMYLSFFLFCDTELNNWIKYSQTLLLQTLSLPHRRSQGFVRCSCPTNVCWIKWLNSFSLFTFANISWSSRADYRRTNRHKSESVEKPNTYVQAWQGVVRDQRVFIWTKFLEISVCVLYISLCKGWIRCHLLIKVVLWVRQQGKL